MSAEQQETLVEVGHLTRYAEIQNVSEDTENTVAKCFVQRWGMLGHGPYTLSNNRAKSVENNLRIAIDRRKQLNIQSEDVENQTVATIRN